MDSELKFVLAQVVSQAQVVSAHLKTSKWIQKLCPMLTHGDGEITEKETFRWRRY